MNSIPINRISGIKCRNTPHKRLYTTNIADRRRTLATATLQTESKPSTAAPPTANVIEILRSRGLIQDITSPDLETVATKESIAVYCGFDPTADSLHLGNLLGIIVLSWFQRCGHTPVALLGGATGRVGDPSGIYSSLLFGIFFFFQYILKINSYDIAGKSAERPVLSEEAIEHNVSGIERILRRLLVVPQGITAPEPLILNNLEWFGPMNLLTFLREIGKYARVGTMIAKDSVKKRMESETGISYTEFTYQLLQGYDFVHMKRHYNVRVQVGGSDQWGNIIAGTELMRKLGGEDEEQVDNGASSSSNSNNDEQCFGMTFPLLLKADGTKFGKSEDGAVGF